MKINSNTPGYVRSVAIDFYALDMSGSRCGAAIVLARSAPRVGAMIFCQYKRGERARPRRCGVVLDECDDLARLSTAEGRGKARNVPDRVFLSFTVPPRNGTDHLYRYNQENDSRKNVRLSFANES